MSLLVGDFRYLILVKQASISRNDYGEEIETWQTLHTLRAAKKFISGAKSINNEEIFTSVNLEFITHYRADITDQMRIECEGVTYTINSIQPIGFKEGLIIIVQKIND